MSIISGVEAMLACVGDNTNLNLFHGTPKRFLFWP